MKAYVLYGIDDLRYEEVDVPVPGRSEVLVKVENAGICGSDIPRIFETGAHRHPLIPGHEFAGSVCAIGEDVDESYMGKRVGVFPLIPCGECMPCRNKQYEMCRNYNYLGSRCDGGFAEYVNVPVRNLIMLPDDVSFEAAAMLEPTSVAAHAMRRMMAAFLVDEDRYNNSDDMQKLLIDNNCSIVVIGLGTIGLLLTMHLISIGISRIYVVGNKEFQKRKALELGVKADNYCDSTKVNATEWIMEKTGGMGADAVFECVGKNETCERAVEAACPAGKVMLVGNPASDMVFPKNTYWKILRNQLSVMGTWNSSFIGHEDDDWHYVVRMISEGRIEPARLISHKLKLHELDRGLHIMKDKTEDYVKVMISCS